MLPRTIVLLVLIAVADGQTVTPRFEVASIRRHVVEVGGPSLRVVRASFGEAISGNRVTEELASLVDLIDDAYDVKDYQISGEPGWAVRGGGAEFYDVVAKTEGDGPPATDQVRLMLQSLLADRFQLKLHRETKELPVYNLVIGKGGAKLRDTSVNAPAPRTALTLPAGMLVMSTPVSTLIGLIAPLADRPVIDKTGLTGIYEYNWIQPSAMRDMSVFTMVQEELGLKLEPAKAQVEILVIDHAEKPTEN